jgi:hypothetical protein
VLVDEGMKLGLDEGKKLGLIASIHDICELLDIALDDGRERELAALDVAGLDALRARLKRERVW